MNFMLEMHRVGEEYRNEEMGTRMFKKLKTIAGYDLSVQCSRYHYCMPRETIDIELYDMFELAIFWQGEFIYPSILENFPRKNELDECYEGQIFGYVPSDLVEDLYKYLNNN